MPSDQRSWYASGANGSSACAVVLRFTTYVPLLVTEIDVGSTRLALTVCCVASLIQSDGSPSVQFTIQVACWIPDNTDGT